MKKILLLLSLVLLFASCNSTELITNNEIDPALREQFKIKSDSIAKTVRTDNKGSYYLLGSEDFFGKLKEKTELLKEIYWDPKIKSAPTVMDEFYIKENGFKNHELHSDKGHYTVHFGNTQQESYVSVLKIHANEQQHYLLAVVYSLKGKSWKIEKIIPARYSFFDYNADDMYKLAKEKESKGFTVDAFVFANGAFNLTKSGGKDLVFDKESEMGRYRKKLLFKLQLSHGKFPIAMTDISQVPELMGFDMAYYKNELYTAVHYGSMTPMNDLQALTKEYEKVKNHIVKTFPDLDTNQSYIFYRAFSMQPGHGHDIHGFLDDNTKTRK